MNQLNDFMASLESGVVPERLRACAPDVERGFQEFLAYAAQSGVPVYGTTTLPGHRDGTPVDVEARETAQHALIDSHCIGGPPHLPADVVRAMSLAKAFSVASLNVPISGDLYRLVLDAFEAKGFAPSVPANASYSSGDVIPAAHWARALMTLGGGDQGYRLKAGEGMALVNGAFVHVAACAALCARLRRFWPTYLEVVRISLSLCGSDRKALLYSTSHADGSAEDWAARCAQHVASV